MVSVQVRRFKSEWKAATSLQITYSVIFSFMWIYVCTWLSQWRIWERCGFNPWVGKIPLEEENDNPLQPSCLGNPVDRGTWRAIPMAGIARVGHDLATKPPSPCTTSGLPCKSWAVSPLSQESMLKVWTVSSSKGRQIILSLKKK